jgi:hypothetical protein
MTSAELSSLADDEDPRILAFALPALAVARHPDLSRALSRAVGCGDPNIEEAALAAMALAAHPGAAAAARVAADGVLGDRALLHLALVADEDAARWLLERMRRKPTPNAIEAVGWAGFLDTVPELVGVLEGGDEQLARLAGAALERLLGAGLVDRVEILPEVLDQAPVHDPDPNAAPPRRGLAELLTDERSRPPSGSSEWLEAASVDPARWQSYWRAHGSNLDSKLRTRRGQAYSPSVSLYELDRLRLTPVERRRLHRELAFRTGAVTRFDPDDFVVMQEASLKSWEGIVAARPAPQGAWGKTR